MTSDRTPHRYTTFIGPPRGGKSTAKGLLIGLVGPGHCVSKSLADFGQQFGLQDALDKRLIVVPDSRDVAGFSRGFALERILALTGGDEIGVPRKYLDAVTTRLPGLLLVQGNKQAAWKDESGALSNRQITIAFDRSFEGAEDMTIPAALAGELPGIANWALKGLERRRANGYLFSISPEVGGRGARRRDRSRPSPDRHRHRYRSRSPLRVRSMALTVITNEE